jgi:hypothetical protein
MLGSETPMRYARLRSRAESPALSNGGEGGIRTLDTGVSPYNGLANSTRPLPIARIQSDTAISGAPSWAEIECSAEVYAPEYAPRGEPKEPQVVIYSPDKLRPHPSYERCGLFVSAEQLSAIDSWDELAFRHPIVITRKGIIIEGYDRWQLARQRSRPEVLCLEYELNDFDSCVWLIYTNRRSRSLNAFALILLAVELEPFLREKALANQIAGGRNKNSSDLTKAAHIHVRSETARISGASSGNVSKVKALVQTIIPEIRQALLDGEIRIHRAHQWSQLPAEQQLAALEDHRSRQGTNLTSRRLIAKHVAKFRPQPASPLTLGDLLKTCRNDSAVFWSIPVSVIDAPGKVAYLTTGASKYLEQQEAACLRKSC